MFYFRGQFYFETMAYGKFRKIATRIYNESGLIGFLDGGPKEKLFAESIQGLTDAPLEWMGNKT